MNYAYGQCSAVVEICPNHEIEELPNGHQWQRFRSIEIIIQPYEVKSEWSGMKHLIASLQAGSPILLPPISIIFGNGTGPGPQNLWTQGVDERSYFRWWTSDVESARSEVNQRDKAWADRIDRGEDMDEPFPERRKYRNMQGRRDATDDSRRRDIWLRVDGYVPVVTELLDFFLDLPPCKAAHVQPIEHLSRRQRGVPRHHPKFRIFDDEYTIDICEALQYWLRGKRDGIELTRGRSIFGEARLEVLAYERYYEDGRLYCNR